MLQFWTACLALLLAPLAAAEAKELKPKFGDIGGVFYTEVSEDREACRQAIENKIALCRQNTSFVSNTLDRKYPGCLPIFEQQASICVAHFRRQAGACEIQGSARITDFTGFACTVTATVVEEGGEAEQAPGIAPADRMMQARTRTNVRSGPGTDHARVGLLEAGEEVHVTGEAGEWLRIEGPDGSTAFVHGSLLVPPVQQGSDPTAALSPKCAGMGKGAKCWNELADKPAAISSIPTTIRPTRRPGPARAKTALPSDREPGGGSPPVVPASERAAWGAARSTATGSGATPTELSRRAPMSTASGTATGSVRGADGYVAEGPYVDSKAHGHWVLRYADGNVAEGPYVDDKRHGRWVERYASGGRLEYDYRNGSSEGQSGVYITESGKRHPGRWSGKCFRDSDGYAWVASGGWDNCPNN